MIVFRDLYHNLDLMGETECVLAFGSKLRWSPQIELEYSHDMLGTLCIVVDAELSL